MIESSLFLHLDSRLSGREKGKAGPGAAFGWIPSDENYLARDAEEPVCAVFPVSALSLHFLRSSAFLTTFSAQLTREPSTHTHTHTESLSLSLSLSLFSAVAATSAHVI